jgi:2-oxoglutarate ferredoxin oxidoreductase subunit beta
VLRKLEEDYDPTDRMRAIDTIERGRVENKLATGLLYQSKGNASLGEDLGLVDEPLASLTLDRVRPPREVLDKIMAGLMTGGGA